MKVASNRERCAVWYKKNSDYQKGKSRAWLAAHPEMARDAFLRRKYGISLEIYKKMLSDQHGYCAVCGMSETTKDRRTGRRKNLSVDHDHGCCPGTRSCGKCVRGLLCYKCNSMVAMSQDRPEVLVGAAEYIKRTRCLVR